MSQINPENKDNGPLAEAVRNLSLAIACVIVIAALAIATVYIVTAIHP